MPEFQVKHTVSDQFLLDVLVTTVESGMSCLWYWAEIDAATPGVVRDDDLNVLSVTFAAEGAGGDECITYGPEQVVLGITRILTGEVKVGDYILNYITSAIADDDAGDIDATAADCIVQAASFNEIVFG